MSIQSVLRFEYEFSAPIDVEAVEEQVTSDAGLLPIRQFDERLGWSAGFAAQLRDKRCGGFHTFVEMVRQRVFGIITCAENDLVVFPVLMHGTARATLGAVDDIRHVMARLRQLWPDVKIHLRADSGFAGPESYEAYEELRIDYTIGLGMNSVLKETSEPTMDAALAAWEQTKQPQRHFAAFDYQAGSWTQPRWVVVKCEAHAQGTNRRAVVTNRPGARVVPQGAYDEYADRGESENRNKELKCELKADRLSDHRYMANLFRLMMHTLAYNLLVRLRRLVAAPPEPPHMDPELPLEARTPQQKRQHFNQRRKADPLGEGHASTWRSQLIKVGARIVQVHRRVRVLLSSAWPFWNHFRMVSQAVLAFGRPTLDSG